MKLALYLLNLRYMVDAKGKRKNGRLKIRNEFKKGDCIEISIM
jgi:hypothetical protein